MATNNSDKIGSAESSIIRATRLVEDVIESNHGLQNHTRQKCYEMARYAEQLYLMLTELAGHGKQLGEEDDHDYSEITTSYSAKTIISTFSHALKHCATEGFGIIEVNRFSVLLDEWFSARFTPAARNPKFKYKADRIPEWIDAMILSYGSYMSDNNTDEFAEELREWIEHIRTDFDEIWPLPYFVSSQSDSLYKKDFTQEAVLVERLLKPQLYDRNFYHTQMHTVQDAVRFYHRDIDSLSTRDLIEMCTLTTTSSFKIEDYS